MSTAASNLRRTKNKDNKTDVFTSVCEICSFLFKELSNISTLYLIFLTKMHRVLLVSYTFFLEHGLPTDTKLWSNQTGTKPICYRETISR